jgi:hypothetical protein
MVNLAALFVLALTALSIVAFAVRAVWRLLFGRVVRRPARVSLRARFRKAISLLARVSRHRRRVHVHSMIRAIGRRIMKWRRISRLHLRIEYS